MFKALERGRENLWDTDSVANRKWDDHQKLEEAHCLCLEGEKKSNHTLLTSCVLLCEEIINRQPLCSLFARLAAELLMFRVELPCVTQDLSIAKRRVEQIKEDFGRMVSTEPYFHFREKWIDAATSLLGTIFLLSIS